MEWWKHNTVEVGSQLFKLLRRPSAMLTNDLHAFRQSSHHWCLISAKCQYAMWTSHQISARVPQIKPQLIVPGLMKELIFKLLCELAVRCERFKRDGN